MKNDQFYAQNGRSTIEMLGVLTIMGLLTIFGIFGYTQAMEKLYLDKQAQQVSDFFAGMVAFTTTNTNATFSSRSEILQTFVQLGYMPDSMVKSTTESDTYLDYFGNSVLIENFYANEEIHIWWYFASTEQFINIAQTLQRFSKNIYLVGIVKSGGYTICYGDKACGSADKPCLSEMTMADWKKEGDQFNGSAMLIKWYRK
jgi:hypothetical protein